MKNQICCLVDTVSFLLVLAIAPKSEKILIDSVQPFIRVTFLRLETLHE